MFAKSRPIVASLLLLLLIPLPVHAQGLLSGVRSSVNSKNHSSESSHHDDEDHHDSHHDHGDDDDDNFLGSLLGSMIGGFLGGGDDHHHDEHHADHHHHEHDLDWGDNPIAPSPEVYFAQYPYANDLDGYMMSEDWVPAPPQSWSARAWFEYGDDYDSLHRWAGRFLVEGCHNWGVDGRWNVYTERISPGVTDNLNIGDANVFFRLGESAHVQARLGLGMNWLADAGSTDLGWNSTLKIDVYPARPVVISGGLDYGSLGGAEMFHGEISVGVIWNRFEIFGGYDYRKIDSTELEGPMFGARIWF